MTSRARRASLLSLPLAALLAVVGAAPARADDTDRERTWAVGVGGAEQQVAWTTFTAGNALFTESQYAAALARYREALLAWDHPAIHYNAAVSLINLDQPLSAYEHIEAALTFGEAPLGEDKYRQALLYQKLLAGQLAELEVECATPGAEVTLDGVTLFRAPGRSHRRLLPGAHQLVARKAGFLSATHALNVPAGTVTREAMTLRAVGATPMRTVRRWATWKPWTTLGAGALVGLIGAAFFAEAKSNFDTFDSEIARLCPAGCRREDLPSTVLDASNRGHWENNVAVGLFVTGGAIAATGVVLLMMNQPRLEPEPTALALSVSPMLGAGTTGLAAALRF